MQLTVALADGTESAPLPVILDTFRILVFGDSIVWGTGLQESQKFHSLVAAAHASNTQLALAVKDANAKLPAPRIAFADPGFDPDKNAAMSGASRRSCLSCRSGARPARKRLPATGR